MCVSVEGQFVVCAGWCWCASRASRAMSEQRRGGVASAVARPTPACLLRLTAVCVLSKIESIDRLPAASESICLILMRLPLFRRRRQQSGPPTTRRREARAASSNAAGERKTSRGSSSSHDVATTPSSLIDWSFVFCNFFFPKPTPSSLQKRTPPDLAAARIQRIARLDPSQSIEPGPLESRRTHITLCVQPRTTTSHLLLLCTGPHTRSDHPWAHLFLGARCTPSRSGPRNGCPIGLATFMRTPRGRLGGGGGCFAWIDLLVAWLWRAPP